MIRQILFLCGLVVSCQCGIFNHGHHYSTGAISTQSVYRDDIPGYQYYHLHDYTPDFHNHVEDSSDHAYPRYNYKYTVNDELTQDKKSHWETRDGDRVEGQYSLLQPDGKTRTVTYKADGHNGFNAIVHTTGGDHDHPHHHHFH